MKVGLYFGSFNPVHVGHLAIANYFVEFTDIEQLWFIISPQNPLKNKKSLLPDYQRFELLYRAVGGDTKYRVSDIEFRMPKPSYTIDTLIYLKEKYPDHQFVIIMGSDGLSTFSKWKNHDQIIQNYPRYVYPRPGSENINTEKHKNIELVNAPLIEISSSFIRQSIKEGKDMRYFLPKDVAEYVTEMHFYE
jgi:nicotinate-nucleotide adenylyltransferase